MPRTPVIVGNNGDEYAPTPAGAPEDAREVETAAAAQEGQPQQEPLPEEVTLVEALLEQFVSEQSPWDYIHAIDEHRVPPEFRHRFYQQFVTLVSQRPQAEQDALLSAGQPVFRYRTETARRDIATLRTSGGQQVKITPSVVCDEWMAEIVHVPDQSPPIKYMIYRPDGETALADRVEIGGVIHLPPQTRLVDIECVMLPSGVEEYDDQFSLLREIRHFVSQYLYVESPRFKNTIAYYVFLTWIYDRFDVVPYLRAQGEFGTGKSRLLQVVGYLSNRAIMAGGATTASPIFRIIDRFKGTLIIDEADFGESELWSEIVKILNCGNMRTPPVLRSERGGGNNKDNFDVQGYVCFGPKVLSTRRRFSDPALESRCLSYTMPTIDVPREMPLFLDQEFRTAALRLRNRLLLWRFRRFREATADPRQKFDGLDARLNQIVIPLLACADNDLMRQEILNHVRDYQKTLKEDRRESPEGLIAHALLRRFKHTKVTGRVLLKEVAEQLRVEHGENGFEKFEPRRLGGMMRHTFGLPTRNIGGVTWVLVGEEDVAKLSKRYNIPAESFERTGVN